MRPRQKFCFLFFAFSKKKKWNMAGKKKDEGRAHFGRTFTPIYRK